MPDEALVPLDAALPDVVAELVVVVVVVAGVVVVAAAVAGVLEGVVVVAVVVAGVVVVPETLVPPEVVERDPVAPVELAVVAELVLPAVRAPEPVELDVVPVLFLAVALVVDPELAPTRATEATAVVVAVRRERAGSLPETSCRKITDQSARNSASAVATTRRRITETRRSRARRRCATSRLASGCALDGAGAAGSLSVGGMGVEASRGVIVTSLRSGRDAMTTRWRRCLAAP